MTKAISALVPDDRLIVLVTAMVELWAPGRRPAYAPMAQAQPLPEAIDSHSASWTEYGARTGVWRLLDILRARELTATFGVSGLVAERFPEAVRAIHEAGHEVAAHSWTQDVVPAQLDPAAERESLARCTDVLTTVTGTRPRGWMSPRATPSPVTAHLLAESGYRWTGDANDRDLPHVVQTPAGPLVTMMHSDFSDIRGAAIGPRAYRDVHLDLLESLLRHDAAAVLTLTVHAHVGGRPAFADMLEQILDRLVAVRDRLWIGTRCQVADAMLGGSSR